MSAKTRHYYVEEVEWLRSTGLNDPALISRALGIKPSSVARALYREGRADLARPFSPTATKRKRTLVCQPCRLGNHEEHRIYLWDTHKCKCGYCKTVTDNVRRSA